MDDFSALILTSNEAPNLSRTLSAISWVKHLIVVDSFSSDRSESIVKTLRPDAAFLQRKFDNHTAQWNFGLDQVRTEWVLTLDADYELSSELRAEITALNPPEDVNGYAAEFIYRIYGHSLRASSYPPRVVLFRVKQARYVDDGHTQKLWVKDGTGELKPPSRRRDDGTTGQQDQRIGRLNGKIYHDDRKPVSHWIQAQDRYAILEARHLLKSAKRKGQGGRNAGEGAAGLSKGEPSLSIQDRLRLKIFFAAPAMFLYLFFWRGLILDGWSGWFYVAQRTIAELLLSIRLLIEKFRLGDGRWKRKMGAAEDDAFGSWGSPNIKAA